MIFRWMLAFPLAWFAFRHDETVSAQTVTVSGREVLWEVDVSRALLEEVVRFPAEPLDLLESELQSVKGPIADYLLRGLSLTSGGRRLSPEVGSLRPEYLPFVTTGQPYIARVHLELRYQAPEDIREINLGLRLFEERIRYHRTVVLVHWDGQVREFTKTGPGEVSVAYDRLFPSFWGTAMYYLAGGLRRFLAGYDTLAFLVALLVFARGRAESAKILAGLILALAVSFFFATRFPSGFSPRVIGALAAASSVYVALENLWLRDSRFRWGIAFGLGLLHGLGLGWSFLARRGEEPGGAFWPEAWYLVGLLGGLAAVLLVFWPLWSILGRSPKEGDPGKPRPWAMWGISAVALLLGLSALLERLTGTALVSRWWHA